MFDLVSGCAVRLDLSARAPKAARGGAGATRALVGVSGGRDSVALLHLLLDQGFNKLVVCHLNHSLRGRASDADARFVERLAARHGLSFVLEKVNVRELAQAQRMSLETAAREARFAFFQKVARRRRCTTLYLGHHADDQVETLLLNLCRGTGRAGLAAMLPRTERDGFTILRPLLGMWREEIDAYLRERKIKFREDASNTDAAHTRNRVRHQLIPTLEKQFGRELRRTLWRTAEILGAEEEWLSNQVPEPTAKLRVDELRVMHIAMQRRTLHAWLIAREVAGVGFTEVEKVRALLDAETAKVNLPGGRHARRRAGLLFIE